MTKWVFGGLGDQGQKSTLSGKCGFWPWYPRPPKNHLAKKHFGVPLINPRPDPDKTTRRESWSQVRHKTVMRSGRGAPPQKAVTTGWGPDMVHRGIANRCALEALGFLGAFGCCEVTQRCTAPPKRAPPEDPAPASRLRVLRHTVFRALPTPLLFKGARPTVLIKSIA